eukprot:c14561_g1_i4.p1 GENE.c14561_g1_i4~~c14561_g1_i4.p1  ORF type:complete len:330 (+),score=62.64 c14561_g1_i4:608-1597(+)
MWPQERLAKYVFDFVSEVKVIYYELNGDKCCDLLNELNVLQLLEAVDGKTHVMKATERVATSLQELEQIFQTGQFLRAVRPLERNHSSSRSHSICEIRFSQSSTLTLVDLAGSERRIDTTNFSGADHRESADINKALLGLKECIRAKSTNETRIPYRAHALTRILKHIFEDPHHQTVFLATFSPSSGDIEHTLNTLRYSVLTNPLFDDSLACVSVECLGTAEELLEEQRFGHWDASRVRQWIQSIDPTNKYETVFGAGLTGKMILKLPQKRIALMCGDDELAAQLFELIREEVRRIDRLVDQRRERNSRIQRLLVPLSTNFRTMAVDDF